MNEVHSMRQKTAKHLPNNSGPLDNLAFFLQLTYNFRGARPRRK